MLVPERIIDGTYGSPEYAVVRSRVHGCGGHPFEVGQDILLPLELPPVGRLVRPYDGRVVFGTQPVYHLVVSYGHDEFQPLFKRP